MRSKSVRQGAFTWILVRFDKHSIDSGCCEINVHPLFRHLTPPLINPEERVNISTTYKAAISKQDLPSPSLQGISSILAGKICDGVGPSRLLMVWTVRPE